MARKPTNPTAPVDEVVRQITAMLNKLKGAGAAGDPELLKLLESLKKEYKEELDLEKKYIKRIEDISEQFKEMKKNLDGFTDAVDASTKGIGKSGGGGGGGGGDGRGKQDTSLTRDLAAAISGQMVGMMGGPKLGQQMFGGLLTQEAEFMQGMRQIGFQTQGITSDTAELQKNFEDIGKVVADTGKSLTEVQQTLMTQMKKGTKGKEQELKLTKTSLGLSTLIGSNADQTADLFHDWQMKLNMSNNQMSEVARGAREVAAQTGVTGDNLLAALKSAEQLATQMRNAGTSSAEANKNFTSMMAVGQKLGIADEMGKVSSALATSVGLYETANEETRNLMFASAAASGQMEALQTGQLSKSKSAMMKLAGGMEQAVEGFLGTTIDKIGEIDPTKLMQINLSLQKVYGMQSNQLITLIKGMKEANQTFSQTTDQIQKDLANANTSAQERINLEKKLSDLQKNKAMSFLTAVDEAGQTAGTSLQDAIKRGMNKFPDMAEDMRKMGLDMSKPLESAAQFTADKLKKAGGKDFGKEVADAIGTGEMSQIRGVLEKMNAEEQKLGVEQAAALDPLSQLNLKTKEMNETLRGYSKGALSFLGGILGANTLMVGYLLSMMVQNVATGGLLSKIGGSIGGKLLGKAGGAVAGASGGAAEKVGSTVAGGVAEKVGSTVATAGGKAAAGAGAAAGGLGKAGGVMGAIGDKVKLVGGKLSGLKFGDFAKVAKLLIKGGAMLILIGTAVAIVAAALIKITQEVMSFVGLTPEKAQEAAKSIAGIMGSFAVIALAIALNAAILLGMGAVFSGAMGPQAIVIAGLMAIGAAALLVLGPVMITLAATLINWCNGIVAESGMDPGKAWEAAKAVAGILGSAAIIAAAVVAMESSLLVLGVLGIVGWLLNPLLETGADCLMDMLPGLVSMSVALIALTTAVMGTVGAYDTAATGAMAKLFLDASAVAATVVAMEASLLVLGALGIVGWIIAPILALGAEALMFMLPGLVDTSRALIALATATMSGYDPATTAATVSALSDLLLGVAKVSGAVLGLQAIFASFAAFEIYAWILIPLMLAGGAALMALAPMVIVIARSILFLAKAALWGYDPKATDELCNNLKSLFVGVDAVIGAIKHLPTEDAFASMPNMPVVKHMLSYFSNVLLQMGEMLSRRVIPALKIMFNVKGDVAHNINTAAYVIESMGKAMGTTIDVIKKFPTWKEFQGMPNIGEGDNQVGTMLTYFGKVIGLMGKTMTDVIIPATTGFKVGEDDAKTINTAAYVIEALGKGMGMAIDVIKKFPTWKEFQGMPNIDKIDPMLVYFGKVVGMMGTNMRTVIIPELMKAFPDNADKDVTKQIKTATVVIETLGKGMSAIIDVVKKIPTWKEFQAMPNMKEIRPIFAYFGNIVKEMGVMMTRDILPMTNEAAASRSGLENVIATIELLPKFLETAKTKIGELLKSKQTMTDISSSIKEFGVAFGGIPALMSDGIIKPLSGMGDITAVEESVKKLMALNQVLDTLVKVMRKISSVVKILSKPTFNMEDAIRQINEALSSVATISPARGVGGAAVAAGAGGSTTAGMPDVTGALVGPGEASAGSQQTTEDSIRQQHVQWGSTGGTSDMAAISNATNDQLSKLDVLHQDNMKIISLLTPSKASTSVGGAALATDTERQAPSPALLTGGWFFNTAQGGGSRAVRTT